MEPHTFSYHVDRAMSCVRHGPPLTISSIVVACFVEGETMLSLVRIPQILVGRHSDSQSR
jgi:hypothetical protein